MHRNHCMPQLICLMSLHCAHWLIRKTGLLLHCPLSRNWPLGSLLNNKGSTWGRCRLGERKKKKSPDISLLLLNITPHHAFIYRKWFFLFFRFHGTRLPSPTRCLGHAWNDFRLPMAHTFPPEVGNVTVDLIAEDWARRVIYLKMVNVKLWEYTWMQGNTGPWECFLSQ